MHMSMLCLSVYHDFYELNMSSYYWYVTKTRAYHLGWDEPVSPSTIEFNGPNMSRLMRPQSTKQMAPLPPHPKNGAKTSLSKME